jgi:hypothetical protein
MAPVGCAACASCAPGGITGRGMLPLFPAVPRSTSCCNAGLSSPSTSRRCIATRSCKGKSVKNNEPGPHSPLWLKPGAPSADQVEAEAKAARLGEIMRTRLSASDGPAFARLLNAEFLKLGLPFRIARKGGPPPRR